MSKALGMRLVWGLCGGLVSVLALASVTRAEVSTDVSGSVLVFPKVIFDSASSVEDNGLSGRDTVIQISNTSNNMVHAHCFYVNGALTFPELPPGPINPPLWTEIDFDIWLTKQQPTHWVVSEGRLVDATDQPCSNNPPFYSCNGAGLDPGRVPPVVEYFTGELKCIEVDPSGAPLSGNHLKGEATTTTFNVCNPITDTCYITGDACTTSSTCPPVTDVAKYNALGVLGNENNDGDGVLCLGGEPSEECPNGAEYDACPQFWIANHFAQGAPDPAVESADVFTSWTIVPCTQNFETQDPETVTIFIETWNEFEQAFSSFATVTCWDELSLDEINEVTFSYDALGTSFAQSRLRPSSQTAAGFMMVGSENWLQNGRASADVNYHVEGARASADLITIPAEQIN
jgi:hypothetical protein